MDKVTQESLNKQKIVELEKQIRMYLATGKKVSPAVTRTRPNVTVDRR